MGTLLGNPDLEFLIERNIEAAKSVGKFGYNKVLNEEFGIECNQDSDDEKYLEFKFRLDKSICNK